ncbi:protein REDUCED CHLOROPLAST COVERAGE 1 isoform X2 [Phragmites australis]|uniref:protein REDUCED CHLOROPLAST COVERAGE 1 isoform X2 n=1 Tax=Phragmites australis TaxID=29695 RepID=UPI002D7779CB|nr:protein REDUCED CHLOROPLAST COVERAGE 1 isoform X2 [Phragmites australis]
MAPKSKRGKAKVLPVAIDITVNLPDQSHVILKGISTDRIIDVRRLLCVNTATCAITNYSFTHETRDGPLKDAADIATLKPCTLTLVDEEYNEERAVEHVRRLLDIVACTTSFGPPPPPPPPLSPKDGDAAKELSNSSSSSKAAASASSGGRRTASPPPAAGAAKDSSAAKEAAAKESTASAELEAEMSGACPRLGAFYEFFSLANLTPPLHFIKRVSQPRQEEQPSDDHLFFLEAKLCSGKFVVVEARRKGFFSLGKQRVLCQNLIDLLRHLSRAFDNVYEDLMKAFLERNKFGNFPYGFRANTWLVPPIAAQSPSMFPPLPAEDETWGGSGGGWGRDGKSNMLPWADEFLYLTSMPCKTAEERELRDRRAFLLHSLFVDVAIFRAIAAVRHVMKSTEVSASTKIDEVLYSETVGNFSITVTRDSSDASCKVDTKIDGSRATGMDSKNLAERNLLKGITADENTAAHDVDSLGIINLRYCGYVAVAKVNNIDKTKVDSSIKPINIADQPEGGAHALNINSLRMLLNEANSTGEKKISNLSQNHRQEELTAAQTFVEKLLKESLEKLEEEETEKQSFMRWELGACWVQHLQDQKNSDKDKKQGSEKEKKKTVDKALKETKVEGLGKPLKALKNSKNAVDTAEKGSSLGAKILSEGTSSAESQKDRASDVELPQGESSASENERLLKDLLLDAAFTRLKESETGLHQKSPPELIEMALKYYDEVALPKLVADFGSLELSPVDGRTLTDFMHTRGLQMRSLGRVVKLSEKLSHVQSLCVHEMIVRAFKHIVRSVIAAISDMRQLALKIAAALNLLLGVPESEVSGSSPNVHPLVWRWLVVFLKKRYEFELTEKHYHDVRKYAILRGLCHKVGIELAPRDFVMDSAFPFHKQDIISLVPVHKQVACSSADGRQLLESSKTALDKGKLEDAVNYGTKALSKLITVCGPYHRMTAGAYSLLAVVLYHTGDFNQATIYQQKALDINERELGLDHPDTMKSYGDLAVFYYRLQHTELALKYVKRALYLLHLTCGPSHPNTAATYINVAMMEEGLGNVHVALRYLHKALKCNQKLLGPDHIQTAASYHAIAIALSLMEAYSLSVQHEQTTLQILRAKLGPDDLRTQDAAAWLEYFESKVIEQQEAARNGTRKPDASIASKGHLSVSDLLDYINPDQENKGRDSESGKRRYSSIKVLSHSNESSNGTSPEISPRDSTPIINEEQQVKELSKDDGVDLISEAEVKQSPKSFEHPAASELPLEIAEVHINLPKEVLQEETVEPEDGWQSVQRPKSAGGPGKQVKHYRPTTRKVYNPNSHDPTYTSQYKARNSYSNNRYYFLRKRTVVPTTYTDPQQHVKVQTSGARFGRKIYKAVTYRVKPGTASSEVEGTSKSTEQMSGKAESQITYSQVQNPTSIDQKESEPHGTLVASIGNAPSYKDVALARPGTIAKTQIQKSRDDVMHSQPSLGQIIAQEMKDSLVDLLKVEQRSVSGNTDNSKVTNVKGEIQRSEETKFSKRELEIENLGKDGLQDMPLSKAEESITESEPAKSKEDANVFSTTNQEPSSSGNDGAAIEFSGSTGSVKAEQSGKSDKEFFEEALPSSIEPIAVSASTTDTGSLGGVGSEKSKPNLLLSNIDLREMPNKKLSAAAPPFNPSPPAVLSPLAGKVGLPPPGAIPGVAPWPVNVSLHPGHSTMVPSGPPLCMSPHHLYPPAPRSPNLLHPMPFIYPPYSQPQVVPSTTYPMNTNIFRPNHYGWQPYMNPAASEFVPVSAWSSSHTVDFIPTPHVVDPISQSLADKHIQSDAAVVSIGLSLDSNTVAAKEEMEAPAVVGSGNFISNKHDDQDKQLKDAARIELNPDIQGDSTHYIGVANHSRSNMKNEDEGSFRIYVKGKSRRKQTLRIPISLLNKTYGSRSFKLAYNKVVRENDIFRPSSVSFADVVSAGN